MYTAAATAVHMTGGVRIAVYVVVFILGIAAAVFAARLWNLWH